MIQAENGGVLSGFLRFLIYSLRPVVIVER